MEWFGFHESWRGAPPLCLISVNRSTSRVDEEDADESRFGLVV